MFSHSTNIGKRHIAAYITKHPPQKGGADFEHINGKYSKFIPPAAAEIIIYIPIITINSIAAQSRRSKAKIENAVRPLMPYPLAFMLSAVSIEFSRARVITIDKIDKAFAALCITLPPDTPRPIHFCAFAVSFICLINCGTNRSVIDSTNDSDGIIRPKR